MYGWKNAGFRRSRHSQTRRSVQSEGHCEGAWVWGIVSFCFRSIGIRKLQKKGRHVKMTDEQRLRDLALANPFIGCEALTVLYNEGADLKLSKSSVHRRLKEAGVEVTKVPATTEDVQDKKTFPKSQTIWKFVAVPEKKKRRVTKRKPKSEAELDGAAPESSGVVDFNQMLNQQVVSMPEALPEAEQDLQLPVHTINILIDPSLGIPEIYAYNKMAGV